MIVTPETNRQNHIVAISLSAITLVAFAVGGLLNPMLWYGLLLVPPVYWLVRRQTKRRMAVMKRPFPEHWEQDLRAHVEFYRVLDESGRERFQNLVKVFLDEVLITGVRTDVDELTRMLVAASAVIPIFGFDDWEYSRLGEVLIYPRAFDAEYQTEDDDGNTLGMIGVRHLSGVMILSKPDLHAGFANTQDKRNVGIHEFAHLVDVGDGSVDGLPVGIPADVVRPWIDWIGRELENPDPGGHIDGYAYTNEGEYFAVLSEYFFEAPEVLAKNDPKTYEMMQAMYRQNTKSMLSGLIRRPKRVGRNSPCPCGSRKKFKRCCGSRRKRGAPR